MSRFLPIGLFFFTVACATAFGIVSFTYLNKINGIQEDARKANVARTEYENRITELKKKLVVEKTETIKVPSTVIQSKCSSTAAFGVHFCVPEIITVTHDVQKVQQSEDPAIRKELDQALENLKQIAAENATNKDSALDLQKIYEFVQSMMKPVISLIVLLAGLFIILSKRYDAVHEKWAYGSLGTIFGIWLK